MPTTRRAAGRGSQDAISMLKADHQRVRELNEQYERAARAKTPDEDRKRRLAERLCQELEVHAQLEEELFYPAVRAVLKDADLVDEATVEHQSARDLIRQIRGMSPGDDLYDAKVKVLGEYVEHHVQEEESQMLPKAKRAKVDLADLARRIDERRRQLESERSMEPFDTIASMLMMPIRAAASAARAGAAAGRRGAGEAGAGTTRTRRAAGAGAAPKRGTNGGTRGAAATTRAAGATRSAATRAAGAATRAATKAAGRATGIARKASDGATTGRKGAGTSRAAGGRASASAGVRSGAGGRGAKAAGQSAKRSRSTR